MDKFLNPYDKQCMKMAMLKHEETFKQQVYELHRLYQVQKLLMKNMEINNVNSGLGTSFRRVEHETDMPEKFPGGNNIEIMDESEIELTLGPSCYSDFSSSSTGSSNNKNNIIEEQLGQERVMRHQKQKQPWLQPLTLNVI